MATTYYHSVGGAILGETSNGSRRDYLVDALGSVTGTCDSDGVQENSYRYQPYGMIASRSGGGADPAFLWVGALGYRNYAGTDASYVRARTFHRGLAQWLQVDPFWPDEDAYVYVSANPFTDTDASGTFTAKRWAGMSSHGSEVPWKTNCGVVISSIVWTGVNNETGYIIQNIVQKFGVRGCGFSQYAVTVPIPYYEAWTVRRRDRERTPSIKDCTGRILKNEDHDSWLTKFPKKIEFWIEDRALSEFVSEKNLPFPAFKKIFRCTGKAPSGWLWHAPKWDEAWIWMGLFPTQRQYQYQETVCCPGGPQSTCTTKVDRVPKMDPWKEGDDCF